MTASKILAFCSGLALIASGATRAAAIDCPSWNWERDSCNNSTGGSWETRQTGDGWSAWNFSGILAFEAGQPEELAVSAVVEHNTCSGSTQASEISKAVTQTDATAWTAEVTLSREVTASANNAALGSLSIKGSEAFKAGTTTTTTVAETATHKATVTTPPYRHLKYKMVIMGMHGARVKLGFFRFRIAEGRCCFDDSWLPFTEVCGSWNSYTCESDSKETWTVPARQCLSSAMHFVSDEVVAECPPPTSPPSMPPTTPPTTPPSMPPTTPTTPPPSTPPPTSPTMPPSTPPT